MLEQLHAQDRTPIPPRTKVVGLAGVALLALTACGDGGESGAEGGEGQSQESPEVPEAPEYSEIESDIWDTMLAAESVTIEADMPATVTDPQAAEGDRATQEYAGALDGSDSSFRQETGEQTQEMRFVDGSVYMAGEFALASFEEQSGGDISAEDHEAEFAGMWVDYTDQIDPSSISPESLLTGLQSEMEGPEGAGEWESEAETRDGEGVWVYTDGEDLEVVVRAGDEPVLLGFEGVKEGESIEVQFADWNDSEGPEAPAPEEVMTLEEATQILAG